MLRFVSIAPALPDILVVPHRSASSQPSDDFNEFLLLLEIMVDFVALRGLGGDSRHLYTGCIRESAIRTRLVYLLHDGAPSLSGLR